MLRVKPSVLHDRKALIIVDTVPREAYHKLMTSVSFFFLLSRPNRSSDVNSSTSKKKKKKEKKSDEAVTGR